MSTAMVSPPLDTVHDTFTANAATLQADNGVPVTPTEEFNTVPPLPEPTQTELEAKAIVEETEQETDRLLVESATEAEEKSENPWSDVIVDELDEMDHKATRTDPDSGYEGSATSVAEASEVDDSPPDPEEMAEMRKKRQEYLAFWVERDNKEAEAKAKSVTQVDEGFRSEDDEPDAVPPTVTVGTFDASPEGGLVDSYESPQDSAAVSPPETPGDISPRVMTEQDLQILETPAGRRAIHLLTSGQATPLTFEGKPPESLYAAIVSRLPTEAQASEAYRRQVAELSEIADDESRPESHRTIARALVAGSEISRGTASNLMATDWQRDPKVGEPPSETSAWVFTIESGLKPDDGDWARQAARISALVDDDHDASASRKLDRFIEERAAAASG